MRPDRRAFVGGAAATVALSLVPLSFAVAAADAGVAEALDAVLAGREALEEGIAIEVPGVAENGAQVPVTVLVESPMTPEDHVAAIHIFATENPTPEIGTFTLTPALGRAEVFTRIRLAEAQEMLVLAELSDGRVLRAAARVTVSVGGCST